MKILLFNPPRFDMIRYGLPNINANGPPLGIASIAAVLEKAQYNVKAIDFYYEPWEKVRGAIASEGADIIGITTLSQQRGSVYRLIHLIKEIDSNIKVVLGGPHSHFMYEQVLQNFPVDFIVLGEGEETFLDLVRALDKNSDVLSVKGIVFKKNGKIIKTQDRSLISDLDGLPFPAYHFFNLDKYSTFERLKSEVYDGVKLEKLKFTTYAFSRGCPGRCAFCSTYKFWGYKWRHRSPGKTVDDLEILVKEYKREYINFVDDIFTVNEDSIIDICKGIIAKKLNMLWDCETRVDFVSEEVLEWMKKAGCILISYGVESASPEILEAINKKTTYEKIIRAFKMTRDAGIKTNMLLMVGNPGESFKSIKATRAMLRKVKPDFLTLSPVMLFPGTALYELAKSKNFCHDSHWLTERPAPFYAVEVSLPRLRFWSDKLMSADKSLFIKLVRFIRSYLVLWTGFDITRRGIHRYKNGRQFS